MKYGNLKFYSHTSIAKYTMKNENIIRKLFQDKLQYRGAALKFASGKEIKLKDMGARLETTDNGVRIFASLDEYIFEILYCKADEAVISCKAILTPKGEVKDKVRTVTALSAFCPAEPDAPLIMHHFTEVGVVERQKRKKKDFSDHHLSLFPKNDIDKAVTFTAKLPAKFYSRIDYEQRKNGVLLNVNTIIPYSFEGKIESEEWFVTVNQLPTDAWEWTAKRYATDRTFETPIGWSTWDYYFTSATEDDVKENVDFIAADDVLSKKIRYIALDDGWQQREGDWKSGVRYPSGLKSLVQYINSKGFEAGIWIAPTRLHFLCGTVMRRNDFLVRDEKGDPIMDEDMYVLDPTHPDGEKFLRETFTYLNDCGFRFYKLDFVSNMVKYADRFYDKSAGQFDALNRLFTIARESVAEGSHIMGCSLPYGADASLSDSRRTGIDIHNTFKHLKKCTEMALWQYASNERLYKNDLDYLVVRGKDTSSDPQTNVLNPNSGKYKAEPTDEFRWRDGEDFSYTEAKCWCGVMLMSGSSIFLGDKLSLLNEKGLDLIKKTLSSADFHAAKPVLTGKEGLPEIWYKEQTGSVYVFNFGEEEKTYDVDLKNGTYRDVFSEETYAVADNKLRILIKAHDCVCLQKGR